jgi:pimeloyl-ACP methyl ester carboxylesterase
MADLLFKTVGGAKVAYKAQGEGKPLLLIHGGEADHGMFRDAVAHLKNSFLTIAYDQRDCGATLREDESAYDLGDLADEAASLITALGFEKAHVLGHSAGGLVAQVLAYRWPERVDKLILEATVPATAAKRLMEGPAFQERLKAVRQGGPAAAAEFFTTPQYVAEHPEIVDLLATLCRRQSPEEIGRRMPALRSVPAELDLSKISAETLVLYAEKDQISPRGESEEMAKVIPNATFQVYPDAGHIGIIQFPEGYANVIAAFLGHPLPR